MSSEKYEFLLNNMEVNRKLCRFLMDTVETLDKQIKKQQEKIIELETKYDNLSSLFLEKDFSQNIK
jgi:hypothetical protein